MTVEYLQLVRDILAIVIWPIALVVTLLILKGPLLKILPAVKRVKYKDVEVEFSAEMSRLKTDALRTFPVEMQPQSKPVEVVGSPKITLLGSEPKTTAVYAEKPLVVTPKTQSRVTLGSTLFGSFRHAKEQRNAASPDADMTELVKDAWNNVRDASFSLAKLHGYKGSIDDYTGVVQALQSVVSVDQYRILNRLNRLYTMIYENDKVLSVDEDNAGKDFILIANTLAQSFRAYVQCEVQTETEQKAA